MALCLPLTMPVSSIVARTYCYHVLTRNSDSQRILPSIYNGFLDKQEAKAEKALRKVADEKGNFRQRQSSPTWGSR
jgi:hypothetical protein